MSTAMGHLLSSSNMIEDYKEVQQEKIDRKRVKNLAKETIDLSVFQQGLHGLGKTINNRHAYLSLTLSARALFSVVNIEHFPYLQNVDVSHNNLITLKPLGALKHLLMLNASFNRIRKLFDFEPSANLEYANFAVNEIQKIENAQKHKYLRILVLDGNQIERIEGLDMNESLRILSLTRNKIQEIQNINHLDLEELYLSENTIKRIQGLKGIQSLFHLDLSRNQIIHLKGLEVAEKLRFLYLHGNNIQKIRQLEFVESLPLISNLDLSFNPIQTKKHYRLQTLYHIPQLRWLDGADITAEEKIKAEALHGLDLADRQAIFKQILPEETFVDRRINTIEDVEPESEDEAEMNEASERIDFIEQLEDPRSSKIGFNYPVSRQDVSSMSSSLYRQRSTQSAQGQIVHNRGGLFPPRGGSVRGMRAVPPIKSSRSSQSPRRSAVTIGPSLLNQSKRYVGDMYQTGHVASEQQMSTSNR